MTPDPPTAQLFPLTPNLPSYICNKPQVPLLKEE